MSAPNWCQVCGTYHARDWQRCAKRQHVSPPTIDYDTPYDVVTLGLVPHLTDACEPCKAVAA